MRYLPAALALSLLATVTASVIHSTPPQPLDPRALALLTAGHEQLAAGKVDAAIDAYEAALAVAPGDSVVFLSLAEATRRQGMQGKALHYYRAALVADPANLRAIAGEGKALVEKGAVDKARRSLSRLEGLCGTNCDETRQLSAAIARGPAPRVVTAEAVKPQPVVTEN